MGFWVWGGAAPPSGNSPRAVLRIVVVLYRVGGLLVLYLFLIRCVNVLYMVVIKIHMAVYRLFRS
jgi:hypothetical protein